MEQPEPNKSQIRGKDLAGAIKVMPMGLDVAIKKRVSGEFKSEQRGGAVSYTYGDQNESVKKETRQMEAFQEEVSEVRSIGTPFQQAGFKTAPMQSPLMNQDSNVMASSMKSSSMQSSSLKQTSSMQSSNQMSTSAMSSQKSMTCNKSSSSSESKSVSIQSSSTMQQDFQQVTGLETSQMITQEIGQDNLKTQLVSAITDLEKDRDFVDFDKENKPINLSSPPQTFSPPPSSFSAKQDAFSPPKQDMFSPPPLEAMEPPQPRPVPASFQSEPQPAPIRNGQNGIQNGFSDFLSGSKAQEVQQFHQETSSSFQQTSSSQKQVIDGSFEESGSVQGSSSSSSLLQKIMTPAQPEYDSGSLKRRDPRKMFTDSSFYNAKHHPTVADQVELAHKLSSAMFNEKNKSTKGQQMFLSRVQNAGSVEVDHSSGQDRVPNLKHVMNPEGRIHEWGDMPADEQPDLAQMATHAAPMLNSPDPIAESLNAEVGKGGELFAKRRKRAENWVVDEASIGQAKPSAFADKFMHEQTERQGQIHQEHLVQQQQKQAVQTQQQTIQQTEQLQQQQMSKQQFTEQQQFKQDQSLELRSQQEQVTARMDQTIDFPDNFKHTDLKARSSTPLLDLSCHNVQGINVWANTAPRGWGGATPVHGLPKAIKQQGLPAVSVTPSTPSIEQSLEQSKLEVHQQMRMEQKIEMQQEEMIRMQMQQMEQQKQQEQMQQQQEQIQIQQEQMLAEQAHIQQEQQIQQEQEMMLQQQQMEMQRQKEEQMRVQQEYEQLQQQKEMERQQEEQRRVQLEYEQVQQLKEMERQQEMELQRQQEEQKRQQEIRQQQERQQQEMQRQQMELQRQQQEAQRMEEQRLMEMQHQQQQQQQEIERQQEERQQMEMQQQTMSQQSSSQLSMNSSTTKTGGMSQQESYESQQTFAQSSSSFSQSTNETQVYEATQNSGAMRGYQVKGEDETGRQHSRTPGVFGGIGGDDNSLVNAEFDYKKHSVKDLAKHFALVKPKTEIPMAYLPEQKMYNGEHGPTLNYLGGKQDFTSHQHTYTKKEVSEEDIEASKQAYELKKKQQKEQKNSSSSTTTTSQQSTVTMRQKTENSEEVHFDQSARRASISSALLMDPASAHAEAGIIDPSAILRGSGTSNRSSIGLRSSVPGETEICASKWDNHNAIARGWAGKKDAYHPVTFREIYNVESQKTPTTQNL